MYPGTVWCTQMLRNAILQKKKEKKNIAISIRTSTTAAKMVIFLVKLRFLFPLLRAIRCPRHETGSGKKRQSNLEWQSKTARPCIGSHTFLIDGSWLLPTKRLFRSAANFDFHDNRPKMADLNRSIVPYFAEDRKDLEISKSSILKKKKESEEQRLDLSELEPETLGSRNFGLSIWATTRRPEAGKEY